MTIKGFADLADLPEDERLRIIGEYVTETGGTAAFIVEDDAKADRYITKLRARYFVREITRQPGPLPGVLIVTIGPLRPN